MTDLRTRIAAVLTRHDQQEISLRCPCGEKYDYWQEHVADAIISELQLTKRLDANRAIPQFHYVTPWEKA
jgi:hypothetical protein